MERRPHPIPTLPQTGTPLNVLVEWLLRGSVPSPVEVPPRLTPA